MKVVVFDMDGTLITESSWELLHCHFDADTEKVRLNREAYFSGLIDYETWMEKDILLWNSPTLKSVREGLSFYTLEPFAEMVVNDLKARGVTPCIVSSGIDILAEMVGTTLRIEPHLIFANELAILNGRLKGVCRVEPSQKDVVLRQLSQRLAVPLSEFAAVGDAAPDISMFKEVALKCAYRPKDLSIVEAADHILEDLRELLTILE
ncbi:MAG: HAD-IB family phosphatase [Theionarchaea archaeon]|nr:MAG: hypothetical protein AYK19_06885 [Theionarchaea archaeon DG-70-1]MBU7026600.1 HAD-IB family phosphatase [Theionarchaea archaeon]